MWYIRREMKRVAREGGTYTTNEQIARRVYRSLKTPSDSDRTTDPIVAFHFKGKDDYILMRCNKAPEISIKGKDQIAGEVKFFAYSDFKEYDERSVLFRLKEDVTLIELYSKGAIKKMTWDSLLAGFHFIWSCKPVLGAMSFDLIATLFGGITTRSASSCSVGSRDSVFRNVRRSRSILPSDSMTCTGSRIVRP